MKKYLLIIICLFSCLTLIACSDPVIETLEIIASTVPEQSTIVDFDYHNVQFTANYSDGKKEVLDVADYMLSSEDLEKFEKAGRHTITINYEGKTVEFIINLVEEAPEVTEIDKLNYSIVVYAVTTLASEGFEAKFNITGKGQFSSFQFRIKYDPNVASVQALVVNDQLAGNLEYSLDETGYIVVNYSRPDNQTTDTYYFTVQFSAVRMYQIFEFDDSYPTAFYRFIFEDIYIVNSYHFSLSR